MGKDEETNEIKLRSEAISLFDVQRWTFDVRCSSLKPTPHGMNTTLNWLENNLALMGINPAAGRERPGKSKKKLMNIERPTSNIELMYSVHLKKDRVKRTHPSTFDILWFACFKIEKA